MPPNSVNGERPHLGGRRQSWESSFYEKHQTSNPPREVRFRMPPGTADRKIKIFGQVGQHLVRALAFQTPIAATTHRRGRATRDPLHLPKALAGDTAPASRKRLCPRRSATGRGPKEKQGTKIECRLYGDRPDAPYARVSGGAEKRCRSKTPEGIMLLPDPNDPRAASPFAVNTFTSRGSPAICGRRTRPTSAPPSLPAR